MDRKMLSHQSILGATSTSTVLLLSMMEYTVY